ncbi:MAG: hypothetical protein WCO44_05715 [Bacteroidota bacterium]
MSTKEWYGWHACFFFRRISRRLSTLFLRALQRHPRPQGVPRLFSTLPDRLCKGIGQFSSATGEFTDFTTRALQLIGSIAGKRVGS